MENTELEVKFLISDLGKIEQRVQQLGGIVTQKRILERNSRFDTSDYSLTQEFRVLRLRMDTAARLTYKGPAQDCNGARLRTEIEFVVGNFEKAQSFLEALGYRVILIYEKFRTVYDFQSVHVAIDELPYGNFIELEGPDPLSIRSVNDLLYLDWKEQVLLSYSALFDRLKSEQNYPFRDLTFNNFRNIIITADLLHIKQADF
jgi:adenylate cyclase class 2